MCPRTSDVYYISIVGHYKKLFTEISDRAEIWNVVRTGRELPCEVVDFLVRLLD